MDFWRGWFWLVEFFKASEMGDQCYNAALPKLKNFLPPVCKNAKVHVASPWHMGKCKTKMLPVYSRNA